MGYPMTPQRVLNRNRLQGKTYGDKPEGCWNTRPWDRELLAQFNDDVDRIDLLLRQLNEVQKGLDAAYGAWGMIAGDLKRLVEDSADEGAIAANIAHRTGIDSETVAVILKEWANL